MILSKADRIDGKNTIFGLVTTDTENKQIIAVLKVSSQYDKVYQVSWSEIKPQTLKHSFDNGTTWHTENEIKEALDAKIKSCENCKYLIGKDKQSKCNFGYLPDNLYEFEFSCSKHEPK